MITNKYQLILGSKSPRRQELLKHITGNVRVLTMEVEEIYPKELPVDQVPEFLAKLKAKPFKGICRGTDLAITADTMVVLGDTIFGKPKDAADAKRILQELSGKKHSVITGVCLTSENKQTSFSVSTQVYFNELTEKEIDFYIEEYQPFDKAGAYAIQEWIGMVAINKIEGDYFNVVGLPVSSLYQAIKAF